MGENSVKSWFSNNKKWDSFKVNKSKTRWMDWTSNQKDTSQMMIITKTKNHKWIRKTWECKILKTIQNVKAPLLISNLLIINAIKSAILKIRCLPKIKLMQIQSVGVSAFFLIHQWTSSTKERKQEILFSKTKLKISSCKSRNQIFNLKT
jgi:hypothetical protein